MTTTAEIRPIVISDLVLDLTIHIRVRTDEWTVERYMTAFDDLPPVHVVQTDDGQLLLADGFHRVQAARQLNRCTILATIQVGTRGDALRLAARANATQGKHGKHLTPGERDDAIRRLHAIDTDRSLRDIAVQMGVSHDTVRRAITVTFATAGDGDHMTGDEFMTDIKTISRESETDLRSIIDQLTGRFGRIAMSSRIIASIISSCK